MRGTSLVTTVQYIYTIHNSDDRLQKQNKAKKSKVPEKNKIRPRHERCCESLVCRLFVHSQLYVHYIIQQLYVTLTPNDSVPCDVFCVLVIIELHTSCSCSSSSSCVSSCCCCCTSCDTSFISLYNTVLWCYYCFLYFP